MISPQWHLPDGDKVRLGKGKINQIMYSPDSAMLAVATDIGIWLYDISNTVNFSLLIPHTTSIQCIAFSSDGKTIATGSRDKTIRLWDVGTGEQKHTLTDQIWFRERYGTEDFKVISFSPDGKLLVNAVSNGTIYLWDTVTGQQKKILKGHTASVINLSFSVDGGMLVSQSWDGTVLVWDIASITNATDGTQ